MITFKTLCTRLDLALNLILYFLILIFILGVRV